MPTPTPFLELYFTKFKISEDIVLIGLIISIVVLVAHQYSTEPLKDSSGKILKDENGEDRTTYTSSGLTATIICSILIVFFSLLGFNQLFGTAIVARMKKNQKTDVTAV
jgi:hypothetical protein